MISEGRYAKVNACEFLSADKGLLDPIPAVYSYPRAQFYSVTCNPDFIVKSVKPAFVGKGQNTYCDECDYATINSHYLQSHKESIHQGISRIINPERTENVHRKKLPATIAFKNAKEFL